MLISIGNDIYMANHMTSIIDDGSLQPLQCIRHTFHEHDKYNEPVNTDRPTTNCESTNSSRWMVRSSVRRTRSRKTSLKLSKRAAVQLSGNKTRRQPCPWNVSAMSRLSLPENSIEIVRWLRAAPVNIISSMIARQQLAATSITDAVHGGRGAHTRFLRRFHAVCRSCTRWKPIPLQREPGCLTCPRLILFLFCARSEQREVYVAQQMYRFS